MEDLDDLGLFCMGVFVGSISTIALQYIHELKDWKYVLSIILPAVFGGVSVTYIKRFTNNKSVACYPIGLLIGLMWSYMYTAKTYIESGKWYLATIGFGQMVGTVVVTVIVVLVVAKSAIRFLKQEWGASR